MATGRCQLSLWPFVAGLALIASGSEAASPLSTLRGLDAAWPSLDALYQDLHRHPELSFQEKRTAALLAERLRALGFDVTEGVGRTGIVGVLRNGNRPVLMVRTDLDALPVAERTGLAYASENAGVMHACGHDVHMTAWIGAATLLSQARSQWRGTLVFVGQPAEETGEGAAAMLADGLLSRFPKPDYVLAMHDTEAMPAGHVDAQPGGVASASNGVDIVFHGKGGHGALPHLAIDPVVIAARTVVALQTIVAREIDPLDAAVVTVGTFNAGTKRNVIPDEATLQLTVRSYKPEVQKHLLESIARIARAEAAAANAPREPTVTVDEHEGNQVLFNDPGMAARVHGAFERGLGTERVDAGPPTMASEDFGAFGRAAGVPSVQFRVGATAADVYARWRAGGPAPPGPHNPAFAPDREPTLRTATTALTLGVLEMLTPAKR